MLERRTLPVGAFFMVLVLGLAGLGVGYGLWSKLLLIRGTVNTGDVNASFFDVFTDDDGVQNNELKDFYDTGKCPIGSGSCDPRESDAENKDDLDHRYDKGVATCIAALANPDPDLGQSGNQGAQVTIHNGYPSYHCNAWFDIQNNGTIPVLLHSVTLQGSAAPKCPEGKEYDLNGDKKPDVEICVSGLSGQGEPQIDPAKIFQMDFDIHVLQDAPQNAGAEGGPPALTFHAEVCLHQWNEETGFCPAPPE